jgi:hypothetical protein
MNAFIYNAKDARLDAIRSEVVGEHVSDITRLIQSRAKAGHAHIAISLDFKRVAIKEAISSRLESLGYDTDVYKGVSGFTMRVSWLEGKA